MKSTLKRDLYSLLKSWGYITLILYKYKKNTELKLKKKNRLGNPSLFIHLIYYWYSRKAIQIIDLIKIIVELIIKQSKIYIQYQKSRSLEIN